MSLSYIFLPISGAHFNPAISAACLVTRYAKSIRKPSAASFFNDQLFASPEVGPGFASWLVTLSEYWINYFRGLPELVQHFRLYRGSSHPRKSAAWPKFDMVWQYLSPIPVGRRGVISSFKWFLPAVATCRGSGKGDRHHVVTLDSSLIEGKRRRVKYKSSLPVKKKLKNQNHA